MKLSDIPCPPPSNYTTRDYTDAESADKAPDPYRVPWGPTGGHLKTDGGQFFESVWGIPDPMRGKGKY